MKIQYTCGGNHNFRSTFSVIIIGTNKLLTLLFIFYSSDNSSSRSGDVLWSLEIKKHHPCLSAAPHEHYAPNLSSRTIPRDVSHPMLDLRHLENLVMIAIGLVANVWDRECHYRPFLTVGYDGNWTCG